MNSLKLKSTISSNHYNILEDYEWRLTIALSLTSLVINYKNEGHEKSYWKKNQDTTKFSNKF